MYKVLLALALVAVASAQLNNAQFQNDMLRMHNELRAKHGSPPLTLNAQITEYAQQWANNLAATDKMQHRSPNKYGENLYMMWGRTPTASDAVNSWYKEMNDCNYQFGKEPSDLCAGHFTQVVWKNSKELGVGFAKSASGKFYIVANYNPAGNYMGQFAANVPKLV